MGQKGRAAIWAVALSIICGLIIWHVVQWYSTGMYLEMFSWIGTDKAYMTVLYNLGLMLVLGTVLGFLTEKITDIIGYKVGGSTSMKGKPTITEDNDLP